MTGIFSARADFSILLGFILACDLGEATGPLIALVSKHNKSQSIKIR